MQRILFVLAFVIASFTVSAQGIIPFIGGNFSGFQVRQKNWSSSGVTGVTLGAMVDLRLSHRFYLQPGIELSAIGYILNDEDTRYPANFESRYGAVQLPVMLVLKTGKEGHQRFFAGAGCYAATNLHFDFGLNLGIGYHMAVGPELYLFYRKGFLSQLESLSINNGTAYQLGIAARWAFKWERKQPHSKQEANIK